MIVKERELIAFLELLKAGLWEIDVKLSQVDAFDFSYIYNIAEEQAVVGLIAAGLEHLVDAKAPKEDVLTFVGSALQLEQRNNDMNCFIKVLVDKMRKAGIYTLLVKGQGIAQCYERPLWRACGDVDFYLSERNYEEAKTFLIPLASIVEKENKQRLHVGMNIDSWIVELHGTLHSSLSRRMNKGLDEVHKSIFYGGDVRSWNNNGVTIFLPSADNDIIIVFSHFITHFYIGGIGLRQVCDWCRLLWTNKESIDTGLLEKRISKMGLLAEWQAFGALSVEYLGMPQEAMPLYKKTNKNSRRARRIMKLIFETGNLGHNIDTSYRKKKSFLVQNGMTLWRRLREFLRLSFIFPLNAPKFFISYVLHHTKESFK